MMFFITVAVESTAAMSTMLQKLLIEIVLEVLTTMLLPCTSVQGILIITQLFEKVNSTLVTRVLKCCRNQMTTHASLGISAKFHTAFPFCVAVVAYRAAPPQEWVM